MIIKNIEFISENGMLQRGNITITDNIISKIELLSKECENLPIESEEKDNQIFDGANFYLSAGLINTHTHLSMSFLKGIADHLPLLEWLQKVIFPVEGKYVSPDFVYFGSVMGAIEQIKTGTTSVVDMYYMAENYSEALKNIGLRSFPGVGHRDGAIEFIEKYKNDSLIHPTLFAHAIYTTSEESIKWVAQQSKKYDIPYQFHLLESESEAVNFKNQKNLDLVPFLESIGFLSDRLIAAHGVWINDSDAEILAKYGVTIAHNSHSNLKLNSGIMPLKNLQKKGINITLGSDGSASNNHISMLLEMDLAAKLGYYKSGEPIHPKEIYFMATKNAQKALKKQIGVIKEGALADLVFINKNHYSMIPNIDPISHIVFSNPEEAIEHVMINGDWVMRNRKLTKIDEEIFYKEIQNYIKTLHLEEFYVKEI
ncbi:amidohydrolase [bacterium]|nr:amidohydrolase [bacterium]